MIVLEGNQNKSSVLVDYVKQLSEKVNANKISVIDYVGNQNIYGGRVNYCSKGEDMILKEFSKDFRKWHESFQNSNYLILELDAPKEMLNEIKLIEQDFNKQIVVTIQNNDLEKVDVYEY
ncbi:hypothetical protein [Lysinibacillus sp. Bpr_S20]|uniref:hypothetical protein n=1 Tax=Lysinibacillus sp. Bpr_S20 TaxID=2933964 RepID=UPI002010F3AD|nr:hypothetical protein [Lysinibacillus sp. Bpr_S20]MCL1700809.1 hypothetical protein [Lysinibacillus sp. Bpr_S20]